MNISFIPKLLYFGFATAKFADLLGSLYISSISGNVLLPSFILSNYNEFSLRLLILIESSK